jgi:hypothetical protein
VIRTTSGWNFVTYFLILWSHHGNICGPTHRITDCWQLSHVFRCGTPPASSGRRKLCLHAFELGTIAWHVCICCKVPTPAPTQCGVHIWKECPCFDKCRTFHGQGMLHGIIYLTYSLLFFCLSHYTYCYFKGFTRPYTACLSLTHNLLSIHLRIISAIKQNPVEPYRGQCSLIL